MGQRISPVHLKILAYTLEVEGYGAQPVLRRCGFASLDDIDEEGDWLPASCLDEMMAEAIDHTGDPSFALLAGKSLALMRYGHMVPLVLSAPHLRAVMNDLARYAALVQDTCELLLDEHHAEGARVRIEPLVGHLGRSGRFRTEFAVTSALQMLRFASAGQHDIWRIDFPYAEPPGLRARYEAAFGPCLHFSQPSCGVTFQPGLLDRPLPSHDPVAYTAARTRAESALQALQRRSDVAQRVHQWLLEQVSVTPPIGDAAQHLGLSERTLRRQLAALNTSYVDLVQQTQRLRAERLLAERHLSIKQVAEQLGFSSVSTFHRAFRRWTGQTPSTWQDTRHT